MQVLRRQDLDSAFINKALKSGDVDFSNSETNKDSCNVYYINYSTKTYSASFKAKNCKENATISDLNINEMAK